MTARDDAIEAAARAEYEWLLSGNTYMTPWADLLEENREHYRKRPARSYDAMAPLIRQAVAEEIATAIEARPDIAYSMTTQPDHLSRRTDAEIARKIGGAS